LEGRGLNSSVKGIFADYFLEGCLKTYYDNTTSSTLEGGGGAGS
jgi:hypothetical protein